MRKKIEKMDGEISDKKRTAHDSNKPFNIDRMYYEFFKIEIIFEK